ncbi:hypothetical protein GIB67_041024 [Kingdonia uniflora]|uniref:Uncharacterized protein n=1 Tax=Kingdonia uniflora TaxID=39325 RepID=A0A7J7NCS9_9MAGN|nr:hypothetical protein GIB67_041024 [Kingdonia uniflora]
MFNHINNNEYGGNIGPVGLSESLIISRTEYEQARKWVLKSHPNYEDWEKQHADFIKYREIATKKKPYHFKLAQEEDFMPLLKNRKAFKESSDIVFSDIVRGPMLVATRLN